jgi:hypothetical protein
MQVSEEESFAPAGGLLEGLGNTFASKYDSDSQTNHPDNPTITGEGDL